MQKVAKVFRFVVLALALLGLLICMGKSYMANHYFDVVLMGAISVILLNTDRLTWALDEPKSQIVITLGLTSKIHNRLLKVMRMIGAKDFVTVCREALTVYDFLVSTFVEDKARIFIETPDGKRAEFVILSPKSTDDKPSGFEIAGTTVIPNCTEDGIRKAVKEQFEKTADKLDLLNELASSDFGTPDERVRESGKKQSEETADKPRESIPPQIR